MPYGRRDPMSETDQADDGHLGASKGRTFRARNQRLCQLGGAQVVGPAEEIGQRDEKD